MTKSCEEDQKVPMLQLAANVVKFEDKRSVKSQSDEETSSC